MTVDSTLSPSREVPVTPPTLPPSLALRLAGYHWSRNLVGQAGATVYHLSGDSLLGLYLKYASGSTAPTLADEMARLQWLAGQLPVATLEHFECTTDEAWLLSRALPGRTAYEWLAEDPAHGSWVIPALARCLQQLHTQPPEQCPFNAQHTLRLAEARRRIDAREVDTDGFDEARAGWTPEKVWQAMTGYLPLKPDPVVSHGDYSLDNILLDGNGQITGLIDLGRLGVADRYQDLAILWNCLEEFGPELQQLLFTTYGLSSPDQDKLNFHLCLDECF